MIRDFTTIPAVDVLDGRAVRLLRGDYDRIELDAGDPLELVRRAASHAPPLVHVVALGTAAFGPTPLREFASDRVAVAIDVADGIVRANGWLESTALTTAHALERCAEAGIATVVCTAIDRDGTRSGPDLELLLEVRARFDGRVLAAGGIRNAADVAAVRELGIDGAVVGRAWLDRTLDLFECNQVGNQPGCSFS
jgi:phosphoribosylformimino-5-aminoimidazole carboxamide ribotide isomerase